MNVRLPRSSTRRHAFWTIVGGMLVIVGADARLLPAQAVAVTERLWAPWRLEYVAGGR